jgi:pyrroloquinoline quinone biosynthesis protein B
MASLLMMGVEVVLLGAAQDGGFPQFGCRCKNCNMVYNKEVPPDSAVSLALIDHASKRWWLVDATPQLNQQWEEFAHLFGRLELSGVILTHAHAGHYPGLLYLGKEALNCESLPLYASSQMHDFLVDNEPWGVLYRNRNILPIVFENELNRIQLSPTLRIEVMPVDHRADFTDTMAFKIFGPNRSLFFCPDIDSWENLPVPLSTIASSMDILLLDSTFYDDDELPGRNMSTIPHPRTIQTFEVLKDVSFHTVVLVHINHSNRLWVDSAAIADVKKRGMIVGRKGMKWSV